MGICYRVLLFDEFDWGYVGFRRSRVSDEVQAVIPYAVLEADIPYLMVFDIDKANPTDLVGKVTADAIYIQKDNNPEIRRIDVVEDNERKKGG